MTPTFRRIVTGRDVSGRSIVESDGQVAEGALGNFNFHRTLSQNSSFEADLGATGMPFFPGPGETIFRMFSLPPGDPSALAEFAAVFFQGVGSPAARVDTSRHPLMHTTPTTDYVVLLSGEASLVLDTGDPIKLKPFDAVVQCGANHAWAVTGSDPALFLAVMVGKAEATLNAGRASP